MEPSRADAEAVAFRLTIANSFLIGATMITLSLNVSLVKQAFTAGVLGTDQWLLVASIILMMFSALVLLLLCYIILINTPLARADLAEVLRRIDTARTYVASAAFLLLASYGSLFLVAFGVSSPWSWLLSAIAYGSAILWLTLRRYYLSKFATRKLDVTK